MKSKNSFLFIVMIITLFGSVEMYSVTRGHATETTANTGTGTGTGTGTLGPNCCKARSFFGTTCEICCPGTPICSGGLFSADCTCGGSPSLTFPNNVTPSDIANVGTYISFLQSSGYSILANAAVDVKNCVVNNKTNDYNYLENIYIDKFESLSESDQSIIDNWISQHFPL